MTERAALALAYSPERVDPGNRDDHVAKELHFGTSFITQAAELGARRPRFVADKLVRILHRQDGDLRGRRVPTLDSGWVVGHARLVLDTQNATRDVRQGRTKVVRH